MRYIALPFSTQGQPFSTQGQTSYHLLFVPLTGNCDTYQIIYMN